MYQEKSCNPDVVLTPRRFLNSAQQQVTYSQRKVNIYSFVEAFGVRLCMYLTFLFLSNQRNINVNLIMKITALQSRNWQ
jgi:hypothetical protein